VALWCCGVVALWRCGVVVLWRCGVVALWCCPYELICCLTNHHYQPLTYIHTNTHQHTPSPSRALNYIDDKGLRMNALVVVGGVAANLELRRTLFELLDGRFVVDFEHFLFFSVCNFFLSRL
jgi:hypothetical protein